MQGGPHAAHVLTEDLSEYSMYNLTGTLIKPLKVIVRVDNMELEMEVDTGASLSIVSKDTYT